MGDWYWIGLAVGIGLGVGVALAGLLAPGRALAPAAAVPAAAVTAAAIGFGIGYALDGFGAAVGGASGGLVGLPSTSSLARGALQGGGTRAGTALILGGAGLALAALALVPALGYAEVVAVPLVSFRLSRRRAGERFAGLRTLARD